jgi:hypothetical protein
MSCVISFFLFRPHLILHACTVKGAKIFSQLNKAYDHVLDSLTKKKTGITSSSAVEDGIPPV